MLKKTSSPTSLLVAIPLLLALLAGCSGGTTSSSSPSPGGKLKIVATTGMIADLAGHIAGDLATVEALMGPGVDPHLYKASESDVRKLAEADLVLYNGLFLEGKMGDILAKLGKSRPVVAIAESLPEKELRRPPEMQGHPDPHIWFDVSLWAKTVTPATEALVRLLPAQEATLRANAARLSTDLATLDAWAASRVAEIPEQARVLVTAHDAFGYFGRRYGLEVYGIQGISTVAEAGLRDVERVVELVASRKIPAIFVESSVPQRTIEAVQAAVREKGHQVAVGGSLFSDAMGSAGTPEGTYDGMVRHNVNTLVDALRGQQKETP